MGWLRALFQKRVLDEQLDKELQFHVDELIRDNLNAGMDPDEARRKALIVFGGTEQIKEECRDARGINWIESVLRDVRYGIRTLRKDWRYTFTAIVALAIGISANTALFSLFNGMVLRPLPVPDPGAVTAIHRTTSRSPGGPFTFPDYVYYRDNNTSFSGVAAYYAAHLRLSGWSLPVAQANGLSSIAGVSGPEQLSGAAEPVIGLFVSGNYFSVMRVAPVLGRSLLPEDDRNSGPPYPVLLSENFWRRRFDRDTGVLGRNLMLSGTSTMVVGITPRDFMGERPEVPDVWLPLAAQQDPQRRLQDRTALCCELEARLKPGVSLLQAQAEVSLLTKTLHQEHADDDQQAAATVQSAVPFGTSQRAYEMIYAILQPAIALVLLIACANVAGLLLGRAASRQREIAIRLALGASRRRLVRQLLTEGVLIAQVAGVISLVLTWWILSFLVKFLSSSLVSAGLSDGGTLFLDIAPDLRVFLYTFAVAGLTGVAFTLVPALHATRPNLTSALKRESAPFGWRGTSRFRGWMVATQIAVCLMLLLGAGMLVMSSVRLLSTDPGFETRAVLDVSILNPGELGYSAARTEELHRLLEARIRTLPGVKSIATASRVPLGGNVTSTTIAPREGQVTNDPRTSAEAPQFPYSRVSPEYFETLGIPLLRGRSFTPEEVKAQAPVAVISDALARHLWPNENPIGKRIRVGSPSQTRFQFQQGIYSESSEVIGVARDVYSASALNPDPGAIYLPQAIGQWDQRWLVRVAGDPRGIGGVLMNEVKSIDPALSVSFQTLDRMITSEPYFVATRLGGVIFAVIGLLGLFLAAVGIYGMVGYSVSQQTREIGIRMALGAQRFEVTRLVLARSMGPVIAGIVAGVVMGVILSQVLSSLFQGLKLLDSTVVLTVSLLLTAISLVAAYVPARRAAKVDPIRALRFE
jgi:predicted permease